MWPRSPGLLGSEIRLTHPSAVTYTGAIP